MATAFTVELEGITEALRAVGLYGDKAVKAARAQIFREASDILAEAIRRTPLDLNALRKSGKVLPQPDGSVIIGFGGQAEAYAEAVHEHLSSHSPPSWVKAEEGGSPVEWSVAGTGPKYLEIPFLEKQTGMSQRIAERLRREAGRV